MLQRQVVKSRTLTELSASTITATQVKAKGQMLERTPTGPAYVCTVGVMEYRSVIPHVVRKGDCVLEIGCHFGTSTALLAGTCHVFWYVCVSQSGCLYPCPGVHACVLQSVCVCVYAPLRVLMRSCMCMPRRHQMAFF
jgi:hypothetical protein